MLDRLVSIVLFLLGYRQTIGARKERVRAANAALHRAVLRRMVLEEYEPHPADLTRLIEGKAREFAVRSTDLLVPEQILNALFSEIFDSDLISPPQRRDLEMRLRRLLDEIERPTKRPLTASADEAFAVSERKSHFVGGLAVATALLGTLASIAPQILGGATLDEEWIRLALGVFLVSLGFIATILAVRTSREDVDEPPIPHPRSARNFELQIARTLERAGMTYRAGIDTGTALADFIVDTKAGPVVLEVKAWDGPVALPFYRRAIETARHLKTATGAIEAIVVVADTKNFPQTLLSADEVRIVAAKDLVSYLQSRAA